MATEYLGSTISLISKSDIRYQGVLHSIDPVEATVSLEKGQFCAVLRCAGRSLMLRTAVRSLGTEGRKGNPAEEIPASENVYE